MGIISKLYIKNFVCRYDKAVGVPYYSDSDFVGLNVDEHVFTNSKGIKIHYCFYNYDKYKEDKVVLFLHGLECGHVAYMAEINEFAKRGYKVLTLDYTGCGYSEGKYLGSIFTPTKDTLELLDLLKIDKEIILAGHSLGGFTAITIANLRKDIRKAVIFAGFISPELELNALVKSIFFVKGILRYEKKMAKDLIALDNIAYLKSTNDKVFFIQSEDDRMIPFSTAYKVLEEINNPSIKLKSYVNRKHNPNYTEAAVQYMNDVFGEFYTKIKDKTIKTAEDRINYFKDVSLEKLVEQDSKLFDEVAKFINE